MYLDNAATTRLSRRAMAAMLPLMEGEQGNPSSLHSYAREARKALERARGQVARCIGADEGEIVFTSGGSEGNNQAVALARGGHVVVGAVEHASVLNAARRVAGEVTLVPTDGEGVVTLEAIERAMRPDTRLVCVQLANNESGVLQPVREIGMLTRARRVPLLCDAVQGFGRVPIDARALNIDLMTLSAHKFYGPRGAGCLYVRQGVPLEPLIEGGGQEFGLRSGTENAPAVEGMRVAAELAARDMAARAERERALAAAFLRRLSARVPDCRLLARNAPRLPGVMALLLPGLPSEQAVADLDLLGVQVSGGAACAARSGRASHVYRAMGLCEADARCVVRVSLGRDNTEGEMEIAAEAIARVYTARKGGKSL